MHKSYDLLLCSIASPILYGIYENQILKESFQTQEKTLDALTKLYTLIHQYEVKRIFYANGPGSFTAIKLTHIFLQTLHIIQGIELFCVDAFYFNQNAPIKAFGNQYFYKQNEEIILQTLQDSLSSCFALPARICVDDFDKKCEPLYVLPAV